MQNYFLNLKARSWEEYIKYIKDSPKDRESFINAITTNKTSFFREKNHFDTIEKHLKELADRESLYVWSAACSYGQEVYSLYVHLKTLVGNSKDIKILGTDLNSEAVNFAREGIYSYSEMSTQVPSVYHLFFEKGKKQKNRDKVRFKEAYKRDVKFTQHNLLNKLETPLKFQIIMLRNILIYFDEQMTERIVRNCIDKLSDDGLFILGLSEGIDYKKFGLQYLGQSVYRKIKEASLKPIKNDIQAKKKKVLVVDDSKVIQKILKASIEKNNKIEVTHTVENGEQAIQYLQNNSVDLITLDLNMPVMGGLDFLRNTDPKKRPPTVIVTSLGQDEGTEVIKALELGAFHYIQKPSFNKKDNEKQYFEDLDNIIQSALEAPKKTTPLSVRKNTLSHSKVSIPSKSSIERIVTIGSSTGGTNILADILSNITNQTPPITIIQHLPKQFSEVFAKRLNDMSPLKVYLAKQNMVLENSCVYLAPGDQHLYIKEENGQFLIKLTSDEPVNRHRPSVDYTYSYNTRLNIAQTAIILRGMGKDGAKEMLKLKELGHFTITQDKNSCSVYGMPRVAKEMGASTADMSPDQIIHYLNGVYSKNKAA